jgi:hypothetical protein
MADARLVLEAAVDEAALLAIGGGEWEADIKPLELLARDALHSADGTIPDERAKELLPSAWQRLGLS